MQEGVASIKVSQGWQEGLTSCGWWVPVAVVCLLVLQLIVRCMLLRHARCDGTLKFRVGFVLQGTSGQRERRRLGGGHAANCVSWLVHGHAVRGGHARAASVQIWSQRGSSLAGRRHVVREWRNVPKDMLRISFLLLGACCASRPQAQKQQEDDHSRTAHAHTRAKGGSGETTNLVRPGTLRPATRPRPVASASTSSANHPRQGEEFATRLPAQVVQEGTCCPEPHQGLADCAPSSPGEPTSTPYSARCVTLHTPPHTPRRLKGNLHRSRRWPPCTIFVPENRRSANRRKKNS